MKGQFEFTEELIRSSYLTEMEVVKIMLEQQLKAAGVSERERMYTGWYARRINPISGNRQYMWDTSIHNKVTNPKMKEYFKSLVSEGWDLAFNIKNLD